MNVYFAAAGLAVVLASYAGTFYMGAEYGDNRRAAREKSTQEIADDAASKAIGDGSKLLSSIVVQNKTVYQKAIHEIQTNTVYRDCRHDSGMLLTINEALTGRRDGAASAAGASVSGNASVGGPDVRSNDGQADRGGRSVPGVPVRGAGAAVPAK